eukprot:TRINITY_DN13027_c0_g1_i14.p1 TRINITY_DN13027_c0_g1~~TRINITY_DN13027_c0_g1_i14.p1  ORF type:complete len:117 (+),score=7.23 TRINITY_DN13027_c0_g1_i14:1-351(+)
MNVQIREGKFKCFSTPLKLRRDWSPVLNGNWTLTHTIDDSSPLAGLVAADQVNEEKVLAFLVFVKGVEATYEVPLHERKVYYTDQFRFGHRFSNMVGIHDNVCVLDPKLLSSTEPV